MSYYFPPQQKPKRWGSIADIQFAIRKNSEKIFGVDPDSNVLNMPLFWGFPCLDFSGKNNHGTPVGGVVYKDGGLDFDGVDDYINAGINTSLQPANTVTIEAWVYARDSNKYRTMVQYGKVAGQSYGINLNNFDDNPNKLQFAFYNGAWRRVDDIDNCPLDIRTHIVGLYDGSTLKIYVNGTFKNSTYYTGSFNYTQTDGLNIGRYYNGAAGNYFNGLISEVRINNIALTAEQIALFYARPWDLYRRVGRTYYSIAAAPSIYIPQIMIF